MPMSVNIGFAFVVMFMAVLMRVFMIMRVGMLMAMFLVLVKMLVAVSMQMLMRMLMLMLVFMLAFHNKSSFQVANGSSAVLSTPEFVLPARPAACHSDLLLEQPRVPHKRQRLRQ